MEWINLSHFSHFHFIRPGWLFSYVFVFLIFRVLIHRDDSLAGWRNVMSTEVLNSLTVAGNNNNWFSPMRLAWLIALCLPIILAGPTWKQQPSPFIEDQAVLIIAPLLASSPVPGTLLLLTDAAKPQSHSFYADYFSNQSHQLLIWGIGRNKAPEGSNIIPMQTSQLEDLSHAGNGRFVSISHDDSDVQKITRHIKNNLVVVENESRPWHDSGYLLTWLVALLFLTWFRKGWTLQW